MTIAKEKNEDLEYSEEFDRFISGDVKFSYGVDKISRFPPEEMSEFAFFGKSNVGKSSLINSVTNRKSIARVSHTPGRTQQINFFNVKNNFFIVDFPGYGFAKVSANLTKSWEKIIIHYLENRQSLSKIFLLIDSRRGIKENDQNVIKIFEKLNHNYWIIFTKSDKISSNEKNKLELQIETLKKEYKFLEKNFFVNNRSKSGASEFKADFWRLIKKGLSR